jgi:hypothetical protein
MKAHLLLNMFDRTKGTFEGTGFIFAGLVISARLVDADLDKSPEQRTRAPCHSLESKS